MKIAQKKSACDSEFSAGILFVNNELKDYLSESCQVCILKRAHEWVIHENDSKHQARASLQVDCPVAVIKLYQVRVYQLLPVATKCDAMIKNRCSSLENCSQANTNVHCSQGGESEVLNV